MIMRDKNFEYIYDDKFAEIPCLFINKVDKNDVITCLEIHYGWNAIIKLGEVITAMNKQHDDAVKTVIDKLLNKPKVIGMIQTTPKVDHFTHITIEHDSRNGIISDDMMDALRYGVEIVQKPLNEVEVEISVTIGENVHKKLEKNKNTDNVTFTEKDLLFPKYPEYNFGTAPKPTKSPKFAIGAKINHYIYGKGEIIGVTFTNQGCPQYVVKFENPHPELRYDDDDFTTIEYFSEKEIDRIINGKKYGNFGWALAMMRKGYKVACAYNDLFNYFIKDGVLHISSLYISEKLTIIHPSLILRTDWKITGKVK